MMIGDGAYGTLLQRHLQTGEFTDVLCTRNGRVVVDAHADYLDAGAQVLQTNTFMAWRYLPHQRRDIYRAGLQCAGEALESRNRPLDAYIATIGPAGVQPRTYYRDIETLLDAGAPGVVCETVTSPAIAAAFLQAWREVARGVTSTAALTLSIFPSHGYDTWRWIGGLDLPDGMSVGLNCCEGPDGLADPLELLAQYEVPLWLVPSAGVSAAAGSSDMEEARDEVDDSERWAEVVAQLAATTPLARVGGCCGTTPDHIERLVAMGANR